MSFTPEELIAHIHALAKQAPAAWMRVVSETLRNLPPDVAPDVVCQRIPLTSNPDLTYRMGELVRSAGGHMTWESLGWALATTQEMLNYCHAMHEIELLWAGPSPASAIPARRIDQALYDLIAGAKQDILLVTFAAAKIERLTVELSRAAQRGIPIRLILEFEQSSEGQLSYDALKAFPPTLIALTEVYCWPVEHRERNESGRPGKLHAKIAIVDDTALVSSANLTDDAFNRNLELGVMIREPAFISSTRNHIESLILGGVLQRL